MTAGAGAAGLRWALSVAAVAIAVTAALMLGFGLAHVRLARVTSNSMAPGVRAGDWVLEQDIRRAASGWVRRGQVVVFRFPSGSDHRAIKRVFGLPGERIVVGQRAISLNGRDIALAGTPGYAPGERRAQTVPAGAVFLLGDNSAASIDSRHFGVAPDSDVVGRVLLMLPRAVVWSGLGAVAAIAAGLLGAATFAARRAPGG